ncbi:MAG: hypothetical protein GC152_10410 [Alphaproteobacteria bacterium]|nr:hypothetical protein [Alphaproteobacteria bacterium]
MSIAVASPLATTMTGDATSAIALPVRAADAMPRTGDPMPELALSTRIGLAAALTILLAALARKIRQGIARPNGAIRVGRPASAPGPLKGSSDDFGRPSLKATLGAYRTAGATAARAIIFSAAIGASIAAFLSAPAFALPLAAAAFIAARALVRMLSKGSAAAAQEAGPAI